MNEINTDKVDLVHDVQTMSQEDIKFSQTEEPIQSFVKATEDMVIDGIEINSGETLLVKNVKLPEKLPQSPYNGVSY
ncbi:MAG: hypothetical protein HKO92_07020, partial [Flavobacteriaceae bacterium]|nr:hypothetical protein [Flavobacteriaceae bacterium]